MLTRRRGRKVATSEAQFPRPVRAAPDPEGRHLRPYCVDHRAIADAVTGRSMGLEHGGQKMASAVEERNVVAEKLAVLRDRAAIRAVDVANMLGTTPETVSRWNRGRAYPRPGKESLLVDLEYIVERLSEFYSDPRTARAWLYSRHKYFDGLRPADLIQEGRIEEVLEAIQTMADPTYT